MLTHEEAAYICASEDGVDLHKHLSPDMVIKVRDLSLVYKSEIPTNNISNQKNSRRTKKIRESTFVPHYETEFIDEANLNNKAYPHIYVIENTLRKLILSHIGADKSWWKTENLPRNVFEYSQKIMAAESNHPWIPSRGKHPIYYVGLEELKKIMNKYWDMHFKWIGEKEKFLIWIDELIPIRNMVAHNSKLQRPDIRTTEEKAIWLINLINNRKKLSEN